MTREFVARGVDTILNETQRAGRRSKGLEVQKIYPRLAANGARVATREAREGPKLHILPFFSKSRVCNVDYVEDNLGNENEKLKARM